MLDGEPLLSVWLSPSVFTAVSSFIFTEESGDFALFESTLGDLRGSLLGAL